MDSKKLKLPSNVTASVPDNDTKLVYHYTIGEHAVSIRRSGIIKCASAYVDKPERPIAWFSSNTEYERSAAKGIPGTGFPPRSATRDEMVSIGLVRLAISSHGLYPWSELGKLARIPPNIVRGLERHARNTGAKPAEWFGSLMPVGIDRVCKVELADYDGSWHDVTYQFEHGLMSISA